MESPALIKAITSDEALLREADGLLADDQHFHLWWLGQSGFLLQWKGERVLIDPYLSDSLTKKYADTEKPHVRLSERVVDPALLRNISIVSSSHNHTDHLDAETLQPILRNNPGIRFIIPKANRDFVTARVGCAPDFPIGLNDGESVSVGAFRFYGIPAKHNEIERDAAGHCRYMGYVIGFANTFIYHSGDTLWFDELVPLLQPFNPDLVLLPINGNKPERRVAGNLDSIEAVKLAQAVQAKNIVPCHYDMFAFNTAAVSDFVQEAEKAGQPYTVLRGGEHLQMKVNE
ncbi:MAG TPA: MBL fold metallo-hydrolase [Flavihumibacter sp.]|nr:MBL fold metallo-hydrolase [Bacteroidota bacterium]HOA37443.1 MBL fold metallo-hydrolase [Flavihumibacter sp.]HPZ86640.1 MBL fold metallo-hydrolase [Flavihumibacter sp.]HQD08953.1 MBL fold metallo-hydrolase [Flavihumibacter sp.]